MKEILELLKKLMDECPMICDTAPDITIGLGICKDSIAITARWYCQDKKHETFGVTRAYLYSDINHTYSTDYLIDAFIEDCNKLRDTIE